MVLFGASRIEQWEPPPAGAGYALANRGVGGQSSAEALARLERDVLALAPALVVVQTGMNDLVRLPRAPAHQQRVIAACVANLAAIARRIAASGARVLLLEIFPPGPPPPADSPRWAAAALPGAVRAANLRLRALAGGPIAVLDCAPVLAGADGRLRPEFAEGTLHLNAAAYRALNRVVVPEIERLLGV
ncbi:MAG: hypothetical protein KatS3mg102_1375 [Planctomycetota bacterium]|nr:MAG: hypothetical protein KatS3mg102_1375 [Planctomycetota bacterium]